MPALPLDKLQLTERDPKTGKLRTLPALHPEIKADRSFVLYRPPPVVRDPALVEEFLERAKFIADDLNWLLALPHDKFWCQVIFDETLQKCLDSYLRYAPRKFDALLDCHPEVNDMQKCLHRSVFLTFLRMSTHKESKDHFITPSVFGEIIYNNFLFDIPKILDLCVLFGKGNGLLLQKMIENIFTQQPSYFSDLDETLPTVLQVFNNILHKCGLQCEGASAEPQKLEEKVNVTPGNMPLQELKDIVLYLCDTCTTLWAFLDVFPLACQTFQKHEFCYRLASFYELAIPELESAIKKRHYEDNSVFADLWRRISHSRKRMIEAFHILINQVCLQPILESSRENIQPFIEQFLQIFTSVLQERRFLRDYDELFPVEDDVSLLQQASSTLDETRTAYILQAVESAWEGVDRRKAQVIKDPTPLAASNGASAIVESTAEDIEELGAAYASEDECAGAAAAPIAKVSGVELDSLISQVKDLLPDLGEGFILACLEEYSYNAEQVINNILEDKLVPYLDKLDRTMQRQLKPDPTPLVTSRYNVFQNDEFDVFSRDSVDVSRIQKGKRREKDTTRSLLNDKRLVAEQKERYSQYSVIVEEIPVQQGEAQLYKEDYEDEYDDTYDGNQVGANDADSDDELISRRPFTIPQVLRPKGQEEGLEEEEEDEEEEEEAEKERTKDHFVQDPAVLRERAEARRLTYLARKGHKQDSSAVVGNVKGHGQNRETVQERRKKEANKSTRANHNRRVMADRKRNKGMIPS
ncbi:activating signal cointegrator 1 complex subunit 2 isoform X1 [Harpia harpyja]|uniref:activating signal cointegrator 1 complex subunit 2 isoform X1 n=3 Tax=Harpia harpyja TaxID=202280 RepID=UPI0022B13FE0|nr:activating signal cointegrator 1 complex subunit 2 isoform X1 [Harpia harpyja]XP_052652834.1 activating signal cointegrator 1 complex subunit 2 isoform X1 [Harpia harpyja]XP_052652835.1 activating signal cointegrator 1 complex subunit 2 isoform X1 [Harpia harpyja]XP_052652836.1 activating signal cointegrator 1 complex subunit 2 isoform X1 [Harpia harpyja]XP_052652840.1 activating signal cointegrator 1 complex subunit 2 isoform X1 [Harpia harpyja]